MLSGIKLNMAHAYSAPVHCIIHSVVYGMVKCEACPESKDTSRVGR
jgi:hypothetical protein